MILNNVMKIKKKIRKTLKTAEEGFEPSLLILEISGLPLTYSKTELTVNLETTGLEPTN